MINFWVAVPVVDFESFDITLKRFDITLNYSEIWTSEVKTILFILLTS